MGAVTFHWVADWKVYRVTGLNVPQEMEGNIDAAQPSSARQSRQLQFSFPPLPVRHPGNGPGIQAIYRLHRLE